MEVTTKPAMHPRLQDQLKINQIKSNKNMIFFFYVRGKICQIREEIQSTPPHLASSSVTVVFLCLNSDCLYRNLVLTVSFFFSFFQRKIGKILEKCQSMEPCKRTSEKRSRFITAPEILTSVINWQWHWWHERCHRNVVFMVTLRSVLKVVMIMTKT